MTNASNDQISEMRQFQLEMAGKVRETPLTSEPTLIAAVDVHLAGERGLAAAVLVQLPNLEVVEQAVAAVDVTFPYVPGFLSFRETPACLAALARLSRRPDLVFADGQGRAHPRRFGLACHIGLEIGIPTVGVAKSILVGKHGPLGSVRGSTANLEYGGETVGVAVRTRTGVTPVYVSVGHLITLAESVDWVLRCCTRYRLPEPSRLAHRLASASARDLRDE